MSAPFDNEPFDPQTTARIEDLLARFHDGDVEARDDLVTLTYHRLRTLTESWLRQYPTVAREMDAGDVLDAGALKRISHALYTLGTTSAAEAFLVASRNIRWELLDLARRLGRRPPHVGLSEASMGAGTGRPEELDWRGEPSSLASRAEFLQKVERLPAAERDVFDLVFSQGMTQAEAAKVLGVSERTVRNRWRSAKEKLLTILFGVPE